MPSVEQITRDIEQVRAALDENEQAFNRLFENYVYLIDFKIALVDETQTRDTLYCAILKDREQR